MKKSFKFIVLILCLVCLNACNNKETIYDVYVNGKGYNLGDKLTIEVNLKTDEKDVKVCPVINIKKEGEKDIGNIANSLNFSTENVEFLNLYLSNFSETYNDDYWTFETILYNNDEIVDLSSGKTIEKINLVLKEKGKYTILLDEKVDLMECDYSYKNSLNLNIIKN